jgi:hypothetical protein
VSAVPSPPLSKSAAVNVSVVPPPSTMARKLLLPAVLVVPAEPTKVPDVSIFVVSGQVITRDKYLIFKDFL